MIHPITTPQCFIYSPLGLAAAKHPARRMTTQGATTRSITSKNYKLFPRYLLHRIKFICVICWRLCAASLVSSRGQLLRWPASQLPPPPEERTRPVCFKILNTPTKILPQNAASIPFAPLHVRRLYPGCRPQWRRDSRRAVTEPPVADLPLTMCRCHTHSLQIHFLYILIQMTFLSFKFQPLFSFFYHSNFTKIKKANDFKPPSQPRSSSRRTAQRI